MGVLAPLAFAWGLLAIIIIALYLLRLRRQPRRVGSTFLWRQVVRDLEANTPWQRLKPSWLLLLQLLALAAIVLALARPFNFVASAVQGETVVLLDTSASMSATDVSPSRFDAAKAEVRTLIDALGPNDAMTLIAMGRTPAVVQNSTGDHAALEAALDALQLGTGDADLGAGLSLAAALMRGHQAEAIIVSDGNTMPATQLGQLPFSVRYIPTGASGAASDNLAIAAFAVRPVDGKQTVLARVVNYGSETHTTGVELYADDRLLDARQVELGKGQGQDLLWSNLPANARILHAHLTAGGALADDDDAWTIIGGQTQARVLLVSSANTFLEKALRLRDGLELVRTDPSTYQPSADYDLQVFDGWLPPSLPAGNLIIVNPPTSTLGISIGQQTGVTRIDGASGDDLLRYVDLSEVHIARTRQMQPAAWSHTVINSDATPLLVAGEESGRHVAVFGFDLHDSDLPLHVAFPILMQNILEWMLPTGTDITQNIKPGDAVPLTLQPGISQAWVIAPGGTRYDLDLPLVTPFANTNRLGLYTLVQKTGNDERRSYFAVNLFAPRESTLQPAARLALDASIEQAGAAPRNVPQEWWTWAALAALLVLGIEWWVYQRGY